MKEFRKRNQEAEKEEEGQYKGTIICTSQLVVAKIKPGEICELGKTLGDHP